MEEFDPEEEFNLDDTEIERYVELFQIYFDDNSNNELPTTNLEIFEQVVNYLIIDFDLELALKICNIWIDNAPESIEAWNSMGVIYSAFGDYDASNICYDKANEIDPKDPEATLQKALNFSMTGNNYLAIKLIDHILEKEPDNEMALYHKNIIFQSIERYSEAIKILEKLHELGEDEYPIYENLAYCYQAMKNYDKAIHYYQIAIEDNPDLYLLWYNLGLVHNLAGHKFQAIECLNNAIALDNEIAYIHFALASIYSQMGRLVQAIDCYTYAYELDPQNIEYIMNLATTLADSGKYDLAISLFSIMIKKNQNIAVPFFGRSLCYDALGEYSKAITDIRKAIKIAPNNPDYLHSYASTLNKINEDKKAIAVYKKCIEIKNKDYIKARKILDSIIEIEPKWFEAYHLIAKTYLEVDDYESAAKYLYELTKVDPIMKAKLINEQPDFYEDLKQKGANNSISIKQNKLKNKDK